MDSHPEHSSDAPRARQGRGIPGAMRSTWVFMSCCEGASVSLIWRSPGGRNPRTQETNVQELFCQTILKKSRRFAKIWTHLETNRTQEINVQGFFVRQLWKHSRNFKNKPCTFMSFFPPYDCRPPALGRHAARPEAVLAAKGLVRRPSWPSGGQNAGFTAALLQNAVFAAPHAAYIAALQQKAGFAAQNAGFTADVLHNMQDKMQV